MKENTTKPGTKDDTKILLTIVISIAIVAVLIIAGWYFIAIGGREIRTRYSWSNYSLFLSAEGDIPEITIRIPYCTNSLDAGTSYFTDYTTENSSYGQIIQIRINDTEYGYMWRFESPIVKDDFSTQYEDKIWIFADVQNYTGNITFGLIKKDDWHTLGLFESQIDYVGVSKNPYPSEFSNYNERADFIDNNLVELKSGWNQYPLCSGTYFQYWD